MATTGQANADASSLEGLEDPVMDKSESEDDEVEEGEDEGSGPPEPDADDGDAVCDTFCDAF